MKIVTNFASPAGRMVPYLIGVFLLLSAVSLFIAIALFVSTRQLSEEVPELEARLAQYRAREVIQTADLLPPEKLVELRARIRQLNELTGTAKQTFPQLLSQLEKLIPDSVWLVDLQYRARENEAKLLVEADRAEMLADFMGRLERSGFFSQVLLTRQTQRAENSHVVQFEIQLRGKP